MEDCKALLPEQLPVLLNKISGTRWKKSQVELALEQLQKETSQRFKEVEKRENNFRDLSMEHCSRWNMTFLDHSLPISMHSRPNLKAHWMMFNLRHWWFRSRPSAVMLKLNFRIKKSCECKQWKTFKKGETRELIVSVFYLWSILCVVCEQVIPQDIMLTIKLCMAFIFWWGPSALTKLVVNENRQNSHFGPGIISYVALEWIGHLTNLCLKYAIKTSGALVAKGKKFGGGSFSNSRRMSIACIVGILNYIVGGKL